LYSLFTAHIEIVGFRFSYLQKVNITPELSRFVSSISIEDCEGEIATSNFTHPYTNE